MNFDLAAVDTSPANTGVEMPIKGIDGKPMQNAKGETPTLVLLGLDSDTYRTYQRRAVMKRIREASAAKRQQIEKSDEEQAAEAAAEAIEQFVMMTVGWKNMRDEVGKEIPFTKDAARELFTKYPMVGEQVDSFCGERANFIKRPSKT